MCPQDQVLKAWSYYFADQIHSWANDYIKCVLIELPQAKEWSSYMNNVTRLKFLRLALRVIGVIFTFAVYPLTQIWPSGWVWHTGQSEYLTMIIGIYATLGIFLLIASRDPFQHRILIWFAVWSSIVHAGIMAVQAILRPEHVGHLYGDVLGLFLVAGVLTWLMPRTPSSTSPGEVS